MIKGSSCMGRSYGQDAESSTLPLLFTRGISVLLLQFILMLPRGLMTAAAAFVSEAPQHPLGGNGWDVAQIMDKLQSLQHQHLWQTLDGTRAYLDHLKNLKQDTWQVGAVEYDESEGPVTAGVSDHHHHRLHRCDGTVGSWCRDWWASELVAYRPPARGNKTCANNCNNVGVCNHDIGICLCPVGWQGDDCTLRKQRLCTNRYSSANDPPGIPAHHMGTNKHDLNLTADGHTLSRCSGYCDDATSGCWCGYNSTYAHIPAPLGSPPGTPPIQWGRPMHDGCKAKTDKDGKPNSWGTVEWDKLYGPTGWCQAEVGSIDHHCGCVNEDLTGPGCQTKKMIFCPNQCNARGECVLGFCKCDPGWYGTSCDKKKAGEPIELVNTTRLGRGAHLVWKEPFQSHLQEEGAEEVLRHARKRPLIYVYDLPTDYAAKILALRLATHACVWRAFGTINESVALDGLYILETYMHDVLLSSPHRTLDPDEADFFYMPMYTSCYVSPVLGWADGPWYYAPTPLPRPMHEMHMVLEAKRWVQQHHPYWNRSEGRDHIFLMTHDESACYAPSEVYEKAIILHHWGRTDPDHTSGSAYWLDNYTQPMDAFPQHQQYDWRDKYRGHPCYTPGKDLLVPAMKQVHDFHASPLMGHPPLKRDILFFFRGDVGLSRDWWYSRGIRQSLFRLAHEDHWREKYKIVIGMRDTYPGDYSSYLARSKFCLVAPGDGWSARTEDAVVHGCIPVLINDNVHPVLHGVVDWINMGVRIPQARLHDLPQILTAIPEEQVLAMQHNISRVWTRFVYATSPGLLHAKLEEAYARTSHARNNTKIDPAHPFRPHHHFPVHRDAFHTIMQWLHSRMPYAKGEATITALLERDGLNPSL